jgi:hypothetical protein
MVQSRRAGGDWTLVAASDALLIGIFPSGRILVINPSRVVLCGTFAGGRLLSTLVDLTAVEPCRSPERKLTLQSLRA